MLSMLRSILHFQKMYGSDAKFAMEPDEFKIFCNSLKRARYIISNTVNKNDLSNLKKNEKYF